MFYKTDVPIKKSEIVKHIKVSRSTLDKNKEISSYIFTYQLLQEQNMFLEDAISKMEQEIKDRKEQK